MYNEKNYRQKAISMYESGKTPAEVVQMILRENLHEKRAVSLADQFYQDYAALVNARKRKKRNVAQRNSLVGGTLLLGGLLLILLSHVIRRGIHDGLFYGLAFIGTVLLGKATIEKNQLIPRKHPIRHRFK